MSEAERKSRETAQDAINKLRLAFIGKLNDDLKHLDELITYSREAVDYGGPDEPLKGIDAIQNIFLPELAGMKVTLETARNVFRKGIK